MNFENRYEAIADMLIAKLNAESSTLPILHKQLDEIEKGIDNLVNAIQAGILTASTKQRLEQLEAEKSEISVQILKEEIAKPTVTKREYEAVKQGGFDIGDVLEFQADLAGSNQLEYHYELVLEDWKRDRRDQLDMEHSFISRHRAAQDFLFPLLDEKDEFEAVHIAHMIARSFYYISPMEARERLVPYLLRYAEVDSAGLRRLVIIALGWVYAENRLREEIECLCRHLESDEDSLCRAWSASAMMQLYF